MCQARPSTSCNQLISDLQHRLVLLAFIRLRAEFSLVRRLSLCLNAQCQWVTTWTARHERSIINAQGVKHKLVVRRPPRARLKLLNVPSVYS
eukprot:6212850-Pleurochrysis_carterae.AAC.2